MSFKVIEGGRSKDKWPGIGQLLFYLGDGKYAVKRTLLGLVFATIMVLTVIRN